MVQPVAMANELTLSITQEIRVNASIEATFAALLEQIGPGNERHDGTPMPMKIEARPGGRWYRDLGNDDGHFWGHVQAIKRPTLLEFSGPLFISSGAFSNVQYRLAPVDGGTLITLKHNAVGFIPEEYRTGIQTGWTHILENVRKAAERVAKK
jgi:uncharacterized protein YndB with AHSA1/START domain